MMVKEWREWTPERIREAERMWAADVPVEIMAERMGYASRESMQGQINVLRATSRGSFPRRNGTGHKVRSDAVEAAAEARGMTYQGLCYRLNRAFDSAGPSLVDAVLDDGVQTPEVD